MSIRGRWQVVETPGYDMALAGAYILFDEAGGEMSTRPEARASRFRQATRRVRGSFGCLHSSSSTSASALAVLRISTASAMFFSE